MTDKFAVGEIIYVIPIRDVAIIALRVEEELVRKTIDGESITYVASSGTQRINLNEIQGNIFRTPAACREFLVRHAVESIDSMLEKAVESAKQRFSTRDVSILPEPEYNTQNE